MLTHRQQYWIKGFSKELEVSWTWQHLLTTAQQKQNVLVVLVQCKKERCERTFSIRQLSSQLVCSAEATREEHEATHYVFSSDVDGLSLYLKAHQPIEKLAACISFVGK